MANQQLVTSLAAFLLSDAGTEVSADNLASVCTASGNTVSPNVLNLFASFVDKAGGIKNFTKAPGGGGAAPAAAAAAPAAAAAVPATPRRETQLLIPSLEGLRRPSVRPHFRGKGYAIRLRHVQANKW